MQNKKVDFDLTGVPQTLLLPLIARAKFSQLPNPPIYDAQAIKFIQEINYDFDKLFAHIGYSTAIWMLARAYQFDEAINAYLEKTPKATIVNLGAGLDTTLYRVDNNQLTWIDIDLPAVTKLREQLLPPPNQRVHYLAASVLDLDWINRVKEISKRVFFLAGGLFMYFQKEQVQTLLNNMALQFPESELIFDAIPNISLNHVNGILNEADMRDAKLQWGLDYGHELEYWSSNIRLISQKTYFQPIKFKSSFPFYIRLRMLFFDLFKRGGIIHVKFLK
ncbi:O-Methyltransferase involved in polyketide biosynthesis [Legionella busanensis]|uniref:O-Methyltransferase involved in polyketide biosynthesis n=1 Tax=Legionella busanensis TaxID=190655 RepID=A0A378JNR2_9GAMM|nr:class I SAM-dependent methyltransferase [Legionella busanensis]STX52318.1 O-Methyltransferase involved in polyketide biosynthesis [Legionella busanensis]